METSSQFASQPALQTDARFPVDLPGDDATPTKTAVPLDVAIVTGLLYQCEATLVDVRKPLPRLTTFDPDSVATFKSACACLQHRAERRLVAL